MRLDLRDEVHIQTTENFANGKIASHNTEIDYQKRYDDWQSNFQRNEDGSIRIKFDKRIREKQVAFANSDLNLVDLDSAANQPKSDSMRPQGWWGKMFAMG